MAGLRRTCIAATNGSIPRSTGVGKPVDAFPSSLWPPGTAGVDRAFVTARLRVEPDRVRVALGADLRHLMAHLSERLDHLRMFVEPARLPLDAVGEPLLMDPRRLDGLAQWHAEV